METIPIDLPAVLQAHRGHLIGKEETAGDARAQLEVLQKALTEACEYGQALWHQLDAQRRYLLSSLPSADRTGTTGAAPTGPDDAVGWQNWQDAFAATTSILAGPHGDSGYGRDRAAVEAQARR